MPYKDPDQQRAYQARWHQARRDAWFAGKSCVKCGNTERLELDHIDPTKFVSHRVFSWTQVKRDLELAKCQVLCYSCHKDKTVADRYARLRHGTNTMYTKYRCRCQPCRDAHAQINSLYR